MNSLELPDETILVSRPNTQVERILTTEKALGIAGGDGFINPAPSTLDLVAKGAGDRCKDRFIDYDPSSKVPNTGKSGGNSLSMEAVNNQKFPDKEDWDINEWLEEDDCNDFEESTESLPVAVDFQYVKDKNGNPTLLIPNIDSTRTMPGRTFNRVEYEQTLSHLHHAPELGVTLPPTFDMNKYNDLPTKADKIQYGKTHLSPETIISYQNKIGHVMSPVFGTGAKTTPLRGFAGKYKSNVSLVIQSMPKLVNGNSHYISIINDRGVHISSYPITPEKLEKIIQDDFWVLKTTNFN